MNITECNVLTARYTKSELTEQQINEICKLKMQYWNYPLKSQVNWFNNNIHPSDIHVLTSIENRLSAYLRLTKRQASTSTGDIIVVGITTVCVIKELAGCGIGREIILFVNRLINSSQNTIGLLHCKYKTSNFYVKCGWKIYNSPIYLLEKPQNKELFKLDDCVMIYAPQVFPDTVITILGNRF
jgi:hypothetical protein